MLINQIKKDRMVAMKAGDSIAKGILTVLIGDIENITLRGKTFSDADVVALIKKYIESNNQTMQADVSKASDLSAENAVLNRYLPKQLDYNAIMDIMVAFGTGTIGELMNHMKVNYAGQYDGKLAKQVADVVIRNQG